MTQQERILKLAQEQIQIVGTSGARFGKTYKAAFELAIRFTLENLWISVMDDLPEVGDRPFSKRVLILCLNGAVTRACYVKQTNSWFCVDAGFGVGNTDVTHWMPFPEPKKRGDVCHNCEHLIYDQDVTGNHFPYCKKYEVGLEPTLMNEHFDWCTDFKEKEGGEK